MATKHETQNRTDCALEAATSLDDLVREVGLLRSQQESLIQADIQHLRELATLNRMADALALRRSTAQIMADALNEAAMITGSNTLWILQPNQHGQVQTVFTMQGVSEAAQTRLPTEATDLFDRIVIEQPGEVLSMPTYDPDAPQGFYMGLPIISAKHVIGCLIIYFDDPEVSHDSHRNRLLQSMLHQVAVACENTRLFEVLSHMIIDVVVAMALAIESRDAYTGGHVLRVTAYATMLGQKLGLDNRQLAVLRLGGWLHDIGKVAVPDAVLNKPGKLDDQEFALMRTHAAVGYDIIKPIPQLAYTLDVIRHHHERFDGRGYPDKLAGHDIPLLARITAIADTFDAMTSDRPYRKGLSHEIALAEITKCAGSQFDPQLAELFVQGEPDRFEAAVENMRRWRAAESRPDSLLLVELLNLDLPGAQ